MVETPLENVIGRGALFDLAHIGSNEAATAAALEQADPGLQAGDMALLHTGWRDRMYGTFPDYFTRSPYLDMSGARGRSSFSRRSSSSNGSPTVCRTIARISG
jgi:arylformamidase